MTWISYFFPQTLVRLSSKYNRDIRVVEETGKLKLLVNGARQSGKYVDDVWNSALDEFKISKLPNVSKILVLGVAGGTVIKILAKDFPKAHFVGVDIDPVMLEIGRKYFCLGSFQNLTLIEQDAKRFIGQASSKHSLYNLVIVDLYSGSDIPDFVETKEFLESLKRILARSGSVVINFSPEKKDEGSIEIMHEKLMETFSSVQSMPVGFHHFFSAQRG